MKYHDCIFDDLFLYGMDIPEEMVDDFKEKALSDEMPEEYIVDTDEVVFKIHKEKKELRILKRKYYDQDVFLGMPSKSKVDFVTMRIYKVGIRAGFNVFLENKYSN
jgi:histidinol phosphatase-like PHP family hydrolase